MYDRETLVRIRDLTIRAMERHSCEINPLVVPYAEGTLAITKKHGTICVIPSSPNVGGRVIISTETLMVFQMARFPTTFEKNVGLTVVDMDGRVAIYDARTGECYYDVRPMANAYALWSATEDVLREEPW